MFQALKIPAYIEHPATRHVLGVLEEGRWSRSRGVFPAFVFSLGAVGLLAVARHAWLAQAGGSSLPNLLYLALMPLPLPLCFFAGFWSGWRGVGRAKGDARLRELFVAGERRETLEALRVGLTGEALVMPAVLHQALFFYLARGGDLPSWSMGTELGPVFLLIAMTAIFLVSAGPALDYGLALGMRERLRGRSAPAALGAAAGCFAASAAALAIGLGVFGLIFLRQRADKAAEEIQDWADGVFE